QRVALPHALSFLDEVALDATWHAHADRYVAIAGHDIARSREQRCGSLAGRKPGRAGDRDPLRPSPEEDEGRDRDRGENERGPRPAPAASPTRAADRRRGAPDARHRQIAAPPIVAAPRRIARRVRHLRTQPRLARLSRGATPRWAAGAQHATPGPGLLPRR